MRVSNFVSFSLYYFIFVFSYVFSFVLFSPALLFFGLNIVLATFLYLFSFVVFMCMFVLVAYYCQRNLRPQVKNRLSLFLSCYGLARHKF